jgi:hypothetical protein
VDRFCKDERHGVSVGLPLIHASAMERIRERQLGYAPVSFPEGDYAIVGDSRGLIETADQKRHRVAAMPSALDAVFRRRVAYLATVALTVILATLPLFDWLSGLCWLSDGNVAGKASNPFDNVRSWHQAMESFSSFLGWAIEVVGSSWNWVMGWLSNLLTWSANSQLLPGWLEAWLRSFARHPALSLFCGVAALWLFVRKTPQIQDQIRARSEYAWNHEPDVSPPKRLWTDRIARSIRTNGTLLVVYDWLTRLVVPIAVAVLVALPACLIIVWFFLPKFGRNKLRRNRYLVRPRAASTPRSTSGPLEPPPPIAT